MNSNTNIKFKCTPYRRVWPFGSPWVESHRISDCKWMFARVSVRSFCNYRTHVEKIKHMQYLPMLAKICSIDKNFRLKCLSSQLPLMIIFVVPNWYWRIDIEIFTKFCWKVSTVTWNQLLLCTAAYLSIPEGSNIGIAPYFSYWCRERKRDKDARTGDVFNRARLQTATSEAWVWVCILSYYLQTMFWRRTRWLVTVWTLYLYC